MIITLYHMLNIMGNLLPFLASTGSAFIVLLLQLRETCFRHPDWVLVLVCHAHIHSFSPVDPAIRVCTSAPRTFWGH